MKKKLLLFGYGNPDRGDDGAAFHIFNRLLATKGIDGEQVFSADVVPLSSHVDLIFNFQLLPEYAEIVAKYDQVIFIDAHTAEIENELNFEPVSAEFKHSPFTHHFSPSSCLAIAESLAGKAPEAWLLSIRGYQFGFDRELSPETSILVEKALHLLRDRYL